MDRIAFIGIDVSRDWFNVALDGDAGKPAQYANDAAGFAAFATAQAGLLPRALVVLEATGGYETALLRFLCARGVRVHRASPLLAKTFIRSLGQKAKTDDLDARGLARYARERTEDLRPFAFPSPEQQELAELCMRRSDLVGQAMAEKARLEHPRYTSAAAMVLQSVEHMLTVLAAQIAAIEARIVALVDEAAPLRRRIAVMRSIKGIGEKTAIALQAGMPELGALDRKAAASLAGCAPHARDSGRTKAKRSTFGGRAGLKRTLFMAAMTARRCNPDLRAFYERLIANGKPKMIALVAVMRKLVVIANAKLRHITPQTTW